MIEIRLATVVPRHALKYRGRESVALMIGDRNDERTYTVRRFVMAPNRDAHPAERFDVHVEDVRYLIGNANVIGAVHSHPHGDHEPSDRDLEFIPDGMIGAVFSDGAITAWYQSKRPLHAVRVVFPTVERAIA